ncbi:MAG: hypothetical protein MUO68_20490, partial [Desulfobacteraceae bacterium]|nr:hypothetical protein [Desulfobacteraceae bacterium]
CLALRSIAGRKARAGRLTRWFYGPKESRLLDSSGFHPAEAGEGIWMKYQKLTHEIINAAYQVHKGKKERMVTGK